MTTDTKHKADPEPHGWYTKSPRSSWNAKCKGCGRRIVSVAGRYWRHEQPDRAS